MKQLLITTIAAVVLVGCGPPKAPDISIHAAAESGNIEAVKQHIAAGTDVNAKDDVGEQALHYAASQGHKEIVELLIANGTDVNAKDDVGWTPLRMAAGYGKKESAELLIANGADVNAKDDEGMTPLHSAAARGHEGVAELLIAKGVDVNAKVASGSKKGLTALDAANETGQTETANLLRKHGGKTGEELKAEGK